MTLQEIAKAVSEMKEENPGAIIDDREELDADAIKEATKKKLKEYSDEETEKIIKQYGGNKTNTTSNYISNLFEEEINNYKAATTPSGFKQFDEITGGIKPGLYIIGAAPSMGKTTFCLQLADQIAANGRKVIYFTLEQTRRELVTKSLNRFTEDDKTRDDIIKDPDTRKEAAQKYIEAVGDNIQIVDGTQARKYNHIEAIIKNNLEFNPVIFIDYLQLIQNGKSKGNLKLDLDEITSSLEALAKNHNLTIIVISSINRGNYYLPANYGAYKEPGGIEFSAEVAIILQLDMFGENYNEKAEAANIQKAEEMKRQEPRPIEAVILKSRSYGLKSIKFNYYAAKDLFKEREAHQQKKANKKI